MERLIPVAIGYAIVTFFVCSTPWGLLIGKFFGVDVRKTGSGNIGATNVGRSVGAGAAALTLALDVAKGWLCCGLARPIISALAQTEVKAFETTEPLGWVLTIVYAACIFGHVFSPWLGFKGGKGISVGFGAALGLDWRIALGLLAVWCIATLPTRYVSLGSSLAAVSLTVWSFVFGYSLPAIVPMFAVTCVVVWAHRENIKRLLAGEEKRFSFKHNEDKE